MLIPMPKTITTCITTRAFSNWRLAAVALGACLHVAPVNAQPELATRFEIKGLYAGMSRSAFLQTVGQGAKCQNVSDLKQQTAAAAAQIGAAIEAYDAGDKAAINPNVLPEQLAEVRRLLPLWERLNKEMTFLQKAGAKTHCEVTRGSFTLAERPAQVTSTMSDERVLALNFNVRAADWVAVSDAIASKFSKSGDWLRRSLEPSARAFTDSTGQGVISQTIGALGLGSELTFPGSTGAMTPTNVSFSLMDKAILKRFSERIKEEESQKKPKDI